MRKTFFKTVRTLLLLICAAVIAQPAAAQTKAQDKEDNVKKVLVVYYSKSGNTREIAKHIQNETNADIFEIETVTPYPEDYNTATKQAKEEINRGYKPPIKNKVSNIDEYDIIFVGSPNWWSTIAPPVSTFLSEHNLSGKTVVPFCTHGGSGISKCASDTAKLAPDSTVLEAAAFSGYGAKNARKEVADWIKKIGVK
ncbi:MAG: NAD(P)H-dependent oxidoreductase [Endomicrobium sp.]|jgi:flavodoxin|nr:NAD(P)H-dependent oxidoreductase [Endomicrobium sp.]